MSYTLGLDLGVVMAKGVLLGLIGCITTLPALILVFDKLLEKTMHKPLMPPLNALTGFVVKRSWIFILVFALLVVPASVCYNRANKVSAVERMVRDGYAGQIMAPSADVLALWIGRCITGQSPL